MARKEGFIKLRMSFEESQRARTIMFVVEGNQMKRKIIAAV